MKNYITGFLFFLMIGLFFSCNKDGNSDFNKNLLGEWQRLNIIPKYVDEVITYDTIVFTAVLKEDGTHTVKDSQFDPFNLGFYPRSDGGYVPDYDEQTVHFYARTKFDPLYDENENNLDRPWYYWRINYLSLDSINVDMYDQFDVLYKSEWYFTKVK